MHIKPFLISAMSLMMFSCITIFPDIKDEPVIDYKIYQGKWYEIARLPNPIEEGLTCITMTYEYQDEGVMTITSKGRSRNDPLDVRTLTGRAWIPDSKEPQKIKIQFIWPITKDYLLVHIDEKKGYAILGSPFKHQLWILSRSPVVIQEDMIELINIAEKNQFKTDTLIRADQVCD